MKKIMMFAVITAIAGVANAEPPTGTQKGNKAFGGPVGDNFVEQLTDKQKSCLEAQNCPKFDMQKPAGNSQPGAMPEKGKMPEMTEEQKASMQANRECMQQAMETCGVNLPERTEQKGGERQGVRSRK